MVYTKLGFRISKCWSEPFLHVSCSWVEFWEVSGDFCVTFLHQEATEKVNKEKILESQETHYSQAERQEMALRYVQAQGGITNGEYCKITRVGERTALRDLEEMVSRGALRATGSKRGRRYIL